MTRARTGRSGIAAAVVLLVAALAGCAQIPSDGPVMPGRPGGNDAVDGVLQIVPEGPRPGATPQDTVVGFLRAATGFQDDHRVARSFLAQTPQLIWRPDSSVVVYPGEPSLSLQTVPPEAAGPVTPTAGAPTPSGAPAPRTAAPTQPDRATVTVSTPIQATIDADGRYTTAAAGTVKKVEFGLVRGGNREWRIDRLADGILVTGTDFDVTFRPFPVYFPDSGLRYLVPDVHWFPGTREVPTSLVRALLSGPPPYLRGAVTTGAPDGTRMAVSAVVVTGGVATVDLTAQARSATARQRQLLSRQLGATLTRLTNIGSVRITVDRVEFDVPRGDLTGDRPGESATLNADPRVDARPVVLDPAGRLARMQADQTLVPVDGVAGLELRGASRPAVSVEGNAFAVLGPGGQSLLLQLPGAPQAQEVVGGSRLTAPSFDPQGWVWGAPTGNAGVVSAARPEIGTVEVRAPWLAGYEVVSLRASRDGARVLVAARRDGRAHAFVAGVLRDATTAPQELTDPLELLPDLVAVADAAWVDEDEVVVLGRRSVQPSDQRPWLVQIGGRISNVPPVPGAQTITAGNGELSIVVGTPTGVQVRAGASWEPPVEGRWPSFPG